MFRSTHYSALVLRAQRAGPLLCRTSQYPIHPIRHRSISSDPRTQDPERAPSNNPFPDSATSTEIPAAGTPSSAENSITEKSLNLDVPQDIFSPPKLSSPDDITQRLTPQSHSDSAGSTSNQPSLARIIKVNDVKERLRSWTESAAVTVRDKSDRYTAVAASTFAQLGRELNKVTGYGEIESLKKQVVEQELRIKATREAAREAKSAHEQAVQQRAKSQREVNDLLQRKSSWTDDDVGRFTALVRQDHLYEQAETRAKLRAAETEEEVEKGFTELMRVILNRYHEEQVWSDKIRSASTYGSLTVLGLNMAVFILAIIIVEPWKRKRLAQTFEKKVEELSGQTVAAFEATHAGVTERLKEQDSILSKLVEVVHHSSHQSREVPAPRAGIDSHAPHIGSEKILPESLPLWVVGASASAAAVIGWIVGSRFS